MFRKEGRYCTGELAGWLFGGGLADRPTGIIVFGTTGIAKENPVQFIAFRHCCDGDPEFLSHRRAWCPPRHIKGARLTQFVSPEAQFII
jgi:hypothetical protein